MQYAPTQLAQTTYKVKWTVILTGLETQKSYDCISSKLNLNANTCYPQVKKDKQMKTFVIKCHLVGSFGHYLIKAITVRMVGSGLPVRELQTTSLGKWTEGQQVRVGSQIDRRERETVKVSKIEPVLAG